MRSSQATSRSSLTRRTRRTSSRKASSSRRRISNTHRQRRRTTSPHNIKQRGGFRVVMPSEYYGGSSGAFQGAPGATSFQSADGETNNSSLGIFNADSTGMCADLAPGGSFPGTEATTTQTGGTSRRRSRSSRVRRRHKQRGGSGAHGRTVLPSKYFGGSTDSFVDSPSQYNAFQTAYGTNSATNHIDFAQGVYNRNLAPGGSTPATEFSGTQTGGGGGRHRRRQRRRGCRRSHNQKNGSTRSSRRR